MKTLTEVIDKLESDGCITTSEREELHDLLEKGCTDFPIDIDSNGDVWFFRRNQFPSQYKGYANDI
jgi:hypothetical protein